MVPRDCPSWTMPKLLCSCKKPHVLVLHNITKLVYLTSSWIITAADSFAPGSISSSGSPTKSSSFTTQDSGGKEKTCSGQKHCHPHSQRLTQTWINFTKRNSTKHFITSNNFRKLMEPSIHQHRSWALSRCTSTGPSKAVSAAMLLEAWSHTQSICGIYKNYGPSEEMWFQIVNCLHRWSTTTIISKDTFFSALPSCTEKSLHKMHLIMHSGMAHVFARLIAYIERLRSNFACQLEKP